MGKEENLIPKEFFKKFKNKEEFQSFFEALYKRAIEEILRGELDDHLGYEKHSKDGYNSGNSRNGYYEKNIKTANLGDIVLNIPRDRKSDFEPLLIPKGQRMSEKLEASIIGMYSRGMTNKDIRAYIEEIYGVGVSESTISHVTDSIIEDIRQWQDRSLEEVYYVVWMDGIVFKIKQDGKYINKCIYLIIGLKKDGKKEVLGMWISENESASFWLNVLNELKSRGVNDILIACIDNLSGFVEAIQAVYPQTTTQLCIVHQIRNSSKYVSWKERKEFCADMKQIYTASSYQTAELAFESFSQKWGKKYSYVIKSWLANWVELTAFFDYPVELRKIIYTTNIIEGLNRGIRKYSKPKTLFPTDMAALKVVYIAIQSVEKSWTKPMENWGLIINQFLIKFADRCKL